MSNDPAGSDHCSVVALAGTPTAYVPAFVADVDDEKATCPATDGSGSKVVVAPNAPLTLSGSAAKALRNAAWSKVTVPSRVRRTPGAPAPLTVPSSRCCSARAVGSPTSGPPLFVVAFQAVAVEICASAALTASTSLPTWPATAVPSTAVRTV